LLFPDYPDCIVYLNQHQTTLTMKKIMVLLLLLSYGITPFCQDIIFKTNGDEISAKVIEISPTEIKYKRFENPEGPNYIIDKNQVLMIKYENGNKDIFNNSANNAAPAPPPVVNVPKPVVVPTETLPDKPFYRNRQHHYFSLSLGYGVSYGGLGIRMQARSGGEVGFGFHWGTGYAPAYRYMGMGTEVGTFMASAGFKLFVYKGIYLDTQFGILGRDYISEYYEGYFIDEYDEILYGPSCLVGVDWIFGKHLGFNLAGGVSSPVNGLSSGEIFPAADLGFLIKF
jgi:hypothetical protein